MHANRLEHDSLGEVTIPGNALYGAQTARAAAWSFSGRRLPLAVIHALARIKAAAAHQNGAANRLPQAIAEATERAALEVAEGHHDAQFVVDLFQTGSATSSNMNVNEVVANRAADLLGASRGNQTVHPNDHVNLGQSSNDVMPSAVQLALLDLGSRRLLPALSTLIERCHALADANWHVVRDGRTHLMRATPIRLGQQFRGYATQLTEAADRVREALDHCRALPLGGTAVGTGIGCPPGLAAAVCDEIARRFGLQVHENANHLGVQGGLDRITWLVAAVRTAGTTLYKIVADLRLQASDMLGELTMPALQPGSSITPGKINPVVCEAALMACAQLYGNDAVVAFANSQGQFELNTMLPSVAHNALEAVELLAGAAEVLVHHGLKGLQVTATAGAAVAHNPMLATALAPVIGYDRAAEIARRAAREGLTVLEVARETTDIDADRLAALLDPAKLCGKFGSNAEPEVE
jgi:fumarate hydratase, class II